MSLFSEPSFQELRRVITNRELALDGTSVERSSRIVELFNRISTTNHLTGISNLLDGNVDSASSWEVLKLVDAINSLASSMIGAERMRTDLLAADFEAARQYREFQIRLLLHKQASEEITREMAARGQRRRDTIEAATQMLQLTNLLTEELKNDLNSRLEEAWAVKVPTMQEKFLLVQQRYEELQHGLAVLPLPNRPLPRRASSGRQLQRSAITVPSSFSAASPGHRDSLSGEEDNSSNGTSYEG